MRVCASAKEREGIKERERIWLACLLHQVSYDSLSIPRGVLYLGSAGVTLWGDPSMFPGQHLVFIFTLYITCQHPLSFRYASVKGQRVYTTLSSPLKGQFDLSLCG